MDVTTCCARRLPTPARCSASDDRPSRLTNFLRWTLRSLLCQSVFSASCRRKDLPLGKHGSNGKMFSIGVSLSSFLSLSQGEKSPLPGAGKEKSWAIIHVIPWPCCFLARKSGNWTRLTLASDVALVSAGRLHASHVLVFRHHAAGPTLLVHTYERPDTGVSVTTCCRCFPNPWSHVFSLFSPGYESSECVPEVPVIIVRLSAQDRTGEQMSAILLSVP